MSNTCSTTNISVQLSSIAPEDTKEDDDVSCRKVPKSKASRAIAKEAKHMPTLVSQKRQYAMGMP